MVGFVFACIGAAVSVLYLGLGVSPLKVLRKSPSETVKSRTTNTDRGVAATKPRPVPSWRGEGWA